MVICNTDKETHGVDPADGRILWSVPGGGKSTPVVAQEYGGDFLLNMSDNRRTGLSAYRLTDKGPQKLWALRKAIAAPARSFSTATSMRLPAAAPATAPTCCASTWTPAK